MAARITILDRIEDLEFDLQEAEAELAELLSDKDGPKHLDWRSDVAWVKRQIFELHDQIDALRDEAEAA